MEIKDFKTREIEIIEELQINEQNRENLTKALTESNFNKNVIIGRLQEVQKWISEVEALDVPDKEE
jgi:hypothetical protein